nr:hypothetical protein [Tanacetum cinerariifolium]
MFDGSTFCEDDVSAAFEDEVAKGFTKVLPSTIAFGLSSSTSSQESADDLMKNLISPFASSFPISSRSFLG